MNYDVFETHWTCIAPRFIVKYWSTVYFPLDKDIVREMWVKGDLKDQLGLSHRKARKNRVVFDDNLEASPMFPNIHGRSLSDLSNSPNTYEHAMANGPPYIVATGQTGYLNTPPMNDTIELPPREPGVQYAQTREITSTPQSRRSSVATSSAWAPQMPMPTLQLASYSPDDEDDRSTIVAETPRASMSTWEGGRAL